MKKYILILTILTAIIGIIGFTVDFAATSFLRVMFLITADIVVILLLGTLFFKQEDGKLVRRKRAVRVNS